VAEIKNVLVPDIGNYKDVPIIEVAVKAGDTVKAEQPLLTLETDKATMDVPAPFDGVVKEVKVKVGDKVSEGALILTLEASGTVAASAPSPAAAPAPTAAAAPAAQSAPAPSVAAQTVTAPASTSASAHASPSIRRFARELGVNLPQVRGSGEKGRVTKDDVQNFVKQSLVQQRCSRWQWFASTGNACRRLRQIWP
jgi:pyruvate dehydrogenase E2 component (dihydrolipoamide acetyltransferase)